MGFFKKGFDAIDKAYEHVQKRPRRFWIPEGATEDFIIVDNDPDMAWEHNFKLNGSWRNPECFELCKTRNNISRVCYLDNRFPKRAPYFAGFNTIIRLTPYTIESRDGKTMTYCYQRNILCTKLGTAQRSGALKVLQEFQKEYGRLKGLVIRAHRASRENESVGIFEVIEQVDPKDMDDYCHDKVSAFLDKINENSENKIEIEDFLNRHPWKPIDFESELKPRRDEEIQKLLSFSSPSSSSGEKSSFGSFGSNSPPPSDDDYGGYGGSGGYDDDVPY